MIDKMLRVLFIAMPLAGCASAEDRYAEKCYDYGYSPGTSEFAQCMSVVAQSDLYRRTLMMHYGNQLLNGY